MVYNSLAMPKVELPIKEMIEMPIGTFALKDYYHYITDIFNPYTLIIGSISYPLIDFFKLGNQGDWFKFLGVLVAFDLITGVAKAKHLGVAKSSTGFRKTVLKGGEYYFILFVTAFLEKEFKIGKFDILFVKQINFQLLWLIYMSLTEIKSIVENFEVLSEKESSSPLILFAKFINKLLKAVKNVISGIK